MKLLIKNLGPIKNNTQEIDLSKRFYVFVGVNNSGKTYISQLLWTIFNRNIIKRFTDRLEEEEIKVKITQEFKINEGMVSDILDKFSRFIEQEMIDIYNVAKNSLFAQKISISFDFDIHELKGHSLVNGVFELSFGNHENSSEYISLAKEVDSLILKIEEKPLPESILKSIPEKVLQNTKKDVELQVKKTAIFFIILMLLENKHTTFFLPSNRSFYPVFYRYVYDIERKNREEVIRKMVDLFEETKGDPSKTNIEELRKAGLFRRQYTEPMNRAIEAIYSLNTNPEEVSHYTNLVRRLAKIMGGDIFIKSLEGIAPIEFFFKPTQQEIDLPMYLASSSVNQLSLLYLYLKHWVVEKSNFLMMDEPEENLHPANQVLLLELLLDFVNQNDNRVLITTHSPLLANVLNNYVYLDILKNEHNSDLDDIIEEHNLKYISSSTSIARKDVGVYFFTGDRIVEYNSGHYSISFRDFQEVTSAIDECADVLTDYIYLKGREEDDDE
ncbi:MAG: AAA family ATPase [Cyanobacteria bacterium P01_E01_bin.42]